ESGLRVSEFSLRCQESQGVDYMDEIVEHDVACGVWQSHTVLLHEDERCGRVDGVTIEGCETTVESDEQRARVRPGQLDELFAFATTAGKWLVDVGRHACAQQLTDDLDVGGGRNVHEGRVDSAVYQGREFGITMLDSIRG